MRHLLGGPPVVFYVARLDTDRRISSQILNNTREQVSRLVILICLEGISYFDN